ncbi:MAG: hypothetical protein JWR46_1175 [Mycobacterium sp.]|jgi:hypothetical protein|nr:hypothetical protein [Mycobacterium sp.]MDT5078739.1 hypothetical protein [Mycobacterium sp.]
MTTRTTGQLAWDLVEHVQSKLDVPQLNTVFLKLGVGDYDFVITLVLGILPQIGATLTPDLVSASQAWVDGYRSSLDYPKLLTLVPSMPRDRTRA